MKPLGRLPVSMAILCSSLCSAANTVFLTRWATWSHSSYAGGRVNAHLYAPTDDGMAAVVAAGYSRHSSDAGRPSQGNTLGSSAAWPPRH